MLWDYASRTLIGRTPTSVSQERAERKFGYHLHRKSVTLFSIILSMGARPWIQTMFLPGRLHPDVLFPTADWYPKLSQEPSSERGLSQRSVELTFSGIQQRLGCCNKE